MATLNFYGGGVPDTGQVISTQPTITVGPTGDFSTLQDALDSLAENYYRGGVTISIQSGTYTEASVEIPNIFEKITIAGDTRDIVGFPFVSGQRINSGGVYGAGFASVPASNTLSSNTADYSPAVSGTPGNNNAVIIHP
jgi:pectin methylesterase-like acyl-CoA thioesterase